MPFNRGRTKYAGASEIGPGWRSAMASGHAISVLSRAYSVSMKADLYLQRAFDALALFLVDSSEGGFRAMFMDR